MYPFRVSGALFLALALFFAACGGEEESDNRVPVAHITALSDGIVDHEIRLDGSGSVAPSAAAQLSYAWTLEAPALSAAVLNGADEPVATFTPDMAGAYQLKLVVTSGKKQSAPSTWTINVSDDPNQAPVADAGPELEVHVGRSIRLDGSRSHDPDGRIKSFRWSLDNAPADSVATLDDETSARPSFVPDKVGDYTFLLVVNDGLRNSQPTSVTLKATNAVPVVTVGQLPAGLAVGDRVQLSITATDPDHDAITYQWELAVPGGSTATLADKTSARPHFVIDRSGEYVATVVASDPWGSSEPVRIGLVVNNRKPVADAGHELVGWIGEPVSLSGTATDGDGQALTYAWTLAGPTGSSAALNNDQTLTPNFIPDVPGIYIATLVTNDGMESGIPSSVNVVVNNRKPSVRIGLIPNQSVGATLPLTGIATDADGHALIWDWALLEVPEGSSATLSGADTSTPTVNLDRVGIYKVTVKVHDGYEWSAEATTRFETPNRLPTVNAGAAQTVNLGDVVALQGTATDLDNQTLTYAWSFASRPSGSTATFSSPDSLTASFAPDKPGNWNVRLTVNDGVGSTTSDVLITVLNRIPVANAGADGVGHISEVFSLVGTGSDDDPGHQAILTYAWTFVSRPTGSTATIATASSATASFTPDKPGDYVVKLTVRDGFDSHEDTLTVSVTNRAPAVVAGANRLIHVGDTFTAAPTFTDPDKQTPTWAWTLVKPTDSTATLTNADKAAASFVADKVGTYTLTVVASDGFAQATDSVTVTVHARPIAVVDDPRTVFINTLVTMDGSRSSDPNSGALTYQWTLVSKPTSSATTIASATTAAPTFTPDKEGPYRLRLVVTNPNGGTGSAEVVITARLPNAAPVARAGDDKSARVNDLVTLDGSASTDAEGAIAQYAWALEAPYASVTLTDASLAKAKFVATAAGVYVVNLTVTDGEGATHTDSVQVTIADNLAPVAQAGAAQTVFVRRSVQLAGTATDPEGDAITAKVWTIEGNVTAEQATLVIDPTDSSKATFTALVDGVFTLRFSATDARGAIGSSTTTVTATWQPPSVQARATPSTVKVGAVANLIGEAADSYGGELVAFYWRIMSAPAGSTATIAGDNQATATFAPDKAGFYVLMFGAEDANHQAALAAVTLQATSDAPVASITGTARVDVGQTATVDGTGSTDADGTIASWAWTFQGRPAGSAATFADASASSTTFVADKPGNYVVKLTVTDNAGVQGTSLFTVVGAAAPVADAGPDKTGFTNQAVALDGGQSSDPMGGSLTYLWTLAPGATDVTLSNANSANASLLATEAGIYTVTLTVTNGLELSHSDTVTVAISVPNAAPVPSIGNDEDVESIVGTLVALVGTAIDADDDAIVSWEWEIEAPEGSNAVLVVDAVDDWKVSFTPDLVGDYVINLIVTDERGKEGNISITVTASFQEITLVAPATVTAGEQAVLVATVADFDAIDTIAWSVVGGPAGATLAPIPAQPGMQNFLAADAGIYTVQVELTDIHGNVATESVAITVVEAEVDPEGP